MVGSRWSRLDREDRDALHAVLSRGTLGVVGDELVTRVVLKLHQPEPCSFDLGAIRILLVRAADAGCPERGIADDTLGELLLGDNVGDREAATASQEPCGLTEDCL